MPDKLLCSFFDDTTFTQRSYGHHHKISDKHIQVTLSSLQFVPKIKIFGKETLEIWDKAQHESTQSRKSDCEKIYGC